MKTLRESLLDASDDILSRMEDEIMDEICKVEYKRLDTGVYVFYAKFPELQEAYKEHKIEGMGFLNSNEPEGIGFKITARERLPKIIVDAANKHHNIPKTGFCMGAFSYDIWAPRNKFKDSFSYSSPIIPSCITSKSDVDICLKYDKISQMKLPAIKKRIRDLFFKLKNDREMLFELYKYCNEGVDRRHTQYYKKLIEKLLK